MTSTRFRPFPPVSCAYGAPMGRASAPLPLADDPSILCVAGPAGEYDCGGAYWGVGPFPVWAVWVRGKGRDGVAYVRARDAKHARMIATGEA